jgi:hypothetical protein
MTIPTRIVTSHFDASSGTPVANQDFSFRRVPWSHRAGSVVLADTIPARTDASGNAATVLWTNVEGMRPSRYTVLYPNGEQSKAFVLPAGTNPISLDELFALELDYGVPDIDDLLDARDASIYASFATTADAALGDALVGAKLTRDGIPQTVHTVLDSFDVQLHSLGNSSTWVWKATTQSGDPGPNSAGANLDDAASATVLYLNRLGAGGTDYGGLIASLRSGDAMYLQQVSDANRWHRLQVTGPPTVTGNAYAIPITHLGDGVGGEPVNNTSLFVSFSPSVSGSGIPPVGGEVPDNSVSSIKIVDGSIVAGDLAPNSVTTAKIVNEAVTTPKLGLDVTGNITGGAPATAQLLKAWSESESFEMTSITRNADGIVTSGTVKWPDSSAGTFTSDTINATWLAVDAYHIGHTASGKTVTQPAVTRDSTGAIVTKPALTVA